MVDIALTKDVTILVPTKNRPNFLFRLLNYYALTGFEGDILVGDASTGDHLNKCVQIIDSFSEKISIKHIIKDVGVNRTLEMLSLEVETDYCCVCTDDDFIVTTGIAKSLLFLKKNPEYSAVHGKGAAIELHCANDNASGNIFGIASYPQSVISSDTGAKRLMDYLKSPKAEIFSIRTTQTCKKMFHGFSSFEWSDIQQITIDELICSGTSTILGKIKEIDGLYLVRQFGHKEQFKRLSPYELIMHKNWSAAINDMKKKFVDEVVSVDGVSYNEADISVNQALTAYLKMFTQNNKKSNTSVDMFSIIKKILDYVPIIKTPLKYFFLSLKKMLNGNSKEISLLDLKNKSSVYYDDLKYVKIACDYSYDKI